jgi:acyl-CoA reductase-like NAD-dependent aldehyde dehydrogenase
VALPDATRFYIGGSWVEPQGTRRGQIVDPATARPVAPIALGNAADAESAIRAARHRMGCLRARGIPRGEVGLRGESGIEA